MMSDHSKRTRSQLTLPEEFGEVHFGVSPLRAARQERRRNQQADFPAESSRSPVPLNVRVGEDDSDDELLLSPHKTRHPKRPPLSPQPGSSPGTDPERQSKRLKQDHNNEYPHVAVTETKQPSGPFDFSSINLDPLSSTSPVQPGSPSKPRAHTVPLVSPSICRRDLGQLMPSPGKASIVPHLREVLRFSSLPHSLELLPRGMDVDHIAKLSEGPNLDQSPVASRTPPPRESDSSGKISVTEVKDSRSDDYQPPVVASGLEVIVSNLSPVRPSSSDLSTMTPQISLEGPNSDLTPKPIKPPQPSPLDVNPIPLTLGDPSSMFDDSPSPLSSLSSLSEFDRTPPPDSDVYTPNVELTSGFPQVTHPPPPATPRGPTKEPDSALTQAGRLTITPPRNRGGSGLAKPSSSVRLTRSASVKQKEAGSVAGSINDKPQGIPSEPSVPSLIPAKRPSDLPGLAPDFSKKSSASVSNKKAFSFAMPTSSSLNKTIGKAPTPSLHQKPSSLPKRQPPKLPSPMKPASSLGPGEPSHPSKYTGLSNLSLALEKLKIPPPLRPATTLGFNSDTRFASNAFDSESAPKVKDDSAIRLGNGLPSGVRASTTPLRRVATIGSMASFEPKAHASGSKPTAPAARSTDPGPPMKKINLHSGVIVGKNSLDKPKGFVYGGVGKMRQFEKVSKKSSLPVVEGSPVKGAESALASNWDEQDLPSTSGIRPMVLPPHKEVDGRGEASTVFAAVEPMKLQEAIAEHGGVLGADSSSLEDGQAESADAWKHASRRASLASQFLQQTLAVLPSTPPPPKAKSKATERPQSSTRSGLRSRSNSNAGGSQSVPRGLPRAQEVDATTSRPASATAAPSPSTKPSSLKVLKACTIFVDVRTDDGDDAGGLFVDMLKGLGAKIIGRAGQSCTHIVYKNGLMSTLSKYRLMREPKPFVVGISWVVECVEQCRRVGEENFLVDLEGLNIAGNNKRRRSMLPKHISSSMQPPPSRPGSSLAGMLASDQSMDRSSVGPDHLLNSSDGPVEDEDDLPPLERARQRRNIFFKS